MANSIQFKNVSKSFTNKLIFSELSYNFYKKNYHLIGKNGSGKSTLLRLIVNLDTTDSGSITINNEYVGTNELTKKIFYVPDDLAIYPFLTGKEFLSWIAKARASNVHEVNEVIDKLELRPHQDAYIADLSFGTKKKYILASALIGRADFIILDEPFNGLDQYSQSVLLTILKEKARYSGLILTTHHDAHIDLLNPIKVRIMNCKLIEEETTIPDYI